MKYIFIVASLFLIIYLTGCAALEGLLLETQEIAATGEANPEIRATLTIIDDLIQNPWDNFLAIAIGYGLALFRRWYKKKKGAKSL